MVFAELPFLQNPKLVEQKPWLKEGVSCQVLSTWQSKISPSAVFCECYNITDFVCN